MGIKKSKASSVAFILLILCFAAVQVQADTSPRFLFDNNFTMPADPEPYVPRILPNKIMFRRPNVGLMIMGGVLGNILGSLGGAFLGFKMSSDEDDLGPIILGYGVGSALGSAAGASLAGYSRDWKGSVGMATLGAVLGVGISWLIVSTPTFRGDAGMLALVPVGILPPVVSAIFYRASMRPRRLPAGNALLNISTDRLGLGVPDIRVRPIFAPGCGSKPEMQFNVNILSVEI